MADDLVIGVDLGTSMVKVGVYTVAGRCVGTSSSPLGVHHVAPGRTEQDLDEFYRAAAAQCRRCLDEFDVEPSAVKAIAFSAQMAGVGIVDAKHRPLAPFDSWLDTRCAGIVDELSVHAPEVIASAGCAPTISIGPKMAWWQRHHPEVCDQAASFVTAAGFVAAVACGRDGASAFIDPTHLHFTSVADVARARWNPGLIDAFAIDGGLLPEIVESTDVVGTLTDTAAKDFGLPTGTVVAAGCGDTAASAVGAGALESGTALDVAGTAAVFAAGTDDFIADVTHRTLMTMRSPFPGRWYALAYVGGAGQVIEWVCREILGFDDVNEAAYEALSEAAGRSDPGADGLSVSPHFDGRITPAAPSMRGSILGLCHSHGRAELARAALESIAFEYRGYLDIIQELQPNWHLRRVIGAGGGTRSATWNQIKADVLGAEYLPVRNADPGTRGAALVAIAALGHELPELEDDQRVGVVTPTLDSVAAYDRLHQQYAWWSGHLAAGYRSAPTSSTHPPTTEGEPS